MFKKHFASILGIIVIIVLGTGLYLTTRERLYSIHGTQYNLGSAIVLSVQPPLDESSAPPPSTDQSSYIADGTLFLLMKNKKQLFFLPSFQQIATFSSNNTLDDKNPIFAYLYIGRFDMRDNAIHYLPLKEAGISSVYFYKKCLTPEDVEKLNKELESVKQLSGFKYLDAGWLKFQTNKNQTESIFIGHWIYDNDLLATVKLKRDKKTLVDAQLDIAYQYQKALKESGRDNLSIHRTDKQ